MDHKPEHIDNTFRKQLHGFAPPPPAFVWDEIEKNLRKRRKRFLFWWFAGGLTGVCLLGFWVFASSPGSTPPIPASSTGIKSSPGMSKPSTAFTAAPVSDNTYTANNNATLKNGSATVANGGIKTFSGASAKISSFDNIVTSPPTNNHTPAPDAPVVSEAQKSGRLETLPGVVDKETSSSLSILPFAGSQSIQPKMLNAPAVAIDLKTVKNAVTIRHAKKTVRNCYDFSKHPLAWMIEAYGGPSLAQREMVSNPDDRPYLNERLKSEHPDLAFNAGVRTTLILQGNFLVRSGLHYDQFTEIFEHFDPNYVKYIVEIVNQGGHQTIDTVGVEYGEEYLKTYNRYGMLDLPLLAGVEFRKGRTGFNFNAGVALNLLFWKRGAIISPDNGEPVYFTPGRAGAADIFKTSAGVSASASIQWFYHLRPRLRVFVEPYFKRVLKPVTLPSHPVEQRYGIGGLRFGVSAILN